jgi:glycosyltransferase involved in cell wall biosynthesis
VRILLDYRPALRARTGVGEYAHELAAALSRTAPPGDRLVLFTSSWRDRPDPALRRWPGVEVVDRQLPVRGLTWAWHRWEWPPIEALAGPADIAHSMHPLAMPTRRAAQVVTIHDLDFLRHPERTAAEIRRDYPELVRAHSARAALVVVNSSHTAAEVREVLGVGAEKLVLCRPGLPAWIGQPTKRPLPAGGYVLFLGTLEPRKNLGLLLDAWQRLTTEIPQLPRLRVAGGPAAGAEQWLERMRTPPLAAHVDYVGYVEASQRRAVYEGARLLVIPSLHEGFGLPALEAMALGVPVVATRRGALPEVVGDAGLLVNADDPREMADAIRAVLTDPSRAEALRDRGLQRASSYTWDAAARTLRDAYARLSNSDHARRH